MKMGHDIRAGYSEDTFRRHIRESVQFSSFVVDKLSSRQILATMKFGKRFNFCLKELKEKMGNESVNGMHESSSRQYPQRNFIQANQFQ